MNIRERQDVVIAAARAPENAGAGYFLSVLESESDGICRWHAIQALGCLRATEAVRALVQILLQPDIEFDESSLHRICAWSLGQIGPVATDEILNILTDAHSDSVAIAALDALGEVRDAAAIPVIKQHLQSGNHQRAIWAALALGKIGEASLPVLQDSLDEADADQVYIVIDTLAIIGTEQTLPVLAKAVSANEAVVNQYFANGQIARASEYLRLVLKSGSPEAGMVAARLSPGVRDLVSGEAE